jgi:hypothetical protein
MLECEADDFPGFISAVTTVWIRRESLRLIFPLIVKRFSAWLYVVWDIGSIITYTLNAQTEVRIFGVQPPHTCTPPLHVADHNTLKTTKIYCAFHYSYFRINIYHDLKLLQPRTVKLCNICNCTHSAYWTHPWLLAKGEISTWLFLEHLKC